MCQVYSWPVAFTAWSAGTEIEAYGNQAAAAESNIFFSKLGRSQAGNLVISNYNW